MYNVLRKNGTKKRNCRRGMGAILLATIVGFNAIPIYGKTIEKPIKEKEAVIKEEVILKPEDKMDDALKAKMKEIKASKNPDEKIPVYVWYTDIDQEEVDEQVEEETGLTREGLDTLGMEEPEKLGAFIKKNTSTNISSADDIEGIKNYLKKTEKQRKKVKEDTDKFIETRREVSKQEYKKHHKKVQKEMKIDKEQVIYESKYAPMVIAKMSCDEIEESVIDIHIEAVELCVDYELISESQAELDSKTENFVYERYLAKYDYQKDAYRSGLTGSKVNIAILEDSVATDDNINEYHHKDIIFGIIDGIAPDAIDYNEIELVDINTYSALYKKIEDLVSSGVKVINCSWGLRPVEGAGENYTVVEKWFDHIVYQHNVTIVKSAANEGEDELISSPGLAYNVITVGALGKVQMQGNSCGNYGNCCTKPDLVARGYLTQEEYGTSYAAPAVTGTIALMLELNPSLAAHPQAVKAILQAGCFEKATNPEANVIVGGGALCKWQGAGMLDVLKVLSIVKQHQYGIGYTENSLDIVKFVEPPYGASKINVSLAWLREARVDEKIFEDLLQKIKDKKLKRNTLQNVIEISTGTRQDLDLYLYTGGSSYIAQSRLENSSTEMVSTTNLSNDFNYEIHIKRYNKSTEPIRYAYAWATDVVDKDYERMPTEIYYFKNRYNGLYMDQNGASGTNNMLQYTFHGGTNQRWIVQKLNGYKTIKSNHSYDMGVLSPGNKYNSFSEWATIAPQQNCDVELKQHDNGAYAILYKNRYTGVSRALAPQLNNNKVGSKLVWRTYNEESDAMHWQLEKLNYRKGDVNTDGIINENDLELFDEFTSRAVFLWGMQQYLADINNDGKVNSTDRKELIRKY